MIKSTQYLYGRKPEFYRNMTFGEALIDRYKRAIWLHHLLVWEGKDEERAKACLKASQWALSMINELSGGRRIKLPTVKEVLNEFGDSIPASS